MCSAAKIAASWPDYQVITDRLISRFRSLLSGPFTVQATSLSIIGAIGREAPETLLCEIIELLVNHLGSSNSALRSLAFAEVSRIEANASDRSCWISLKPTAKLRMP
jgi:hypothetical protein